MKVHYLHVIVIDHDHLGADEVERVLEDANYPNDCIAPSVIKSQSAEIGDWDDDNPLNHSDTQAAEVDRLFSPWQPIETAPRDGTHTLAYDGKDIHKSFYNVACDEWFAFNNLNSCAFRVTAFIPLYWIPWQNPPAARC